VSSPSQYVVLIEERDDYVYIIYGGQFDSERALEALERSSAVIRQPGTRNIVADLRSADIVDPGVFDMIVAAARENADYVRRSAIIGIHGAKRFLLEEMVRQSGREDMRVVANLDEALAWISGG